MKATSDNASEQAAEESASASPEQVEINLAETTEAAVETKANAPVAKAPGKQQVSETSSLAASGKGKRGASHPMALPAEVNDAFVDLALTAKADNERPALAVSGKTAAMAQAGSRASAPTTLPKSVDADAVAQ